MSEQPGANTTDDEYLRVLRDRLVTVGSRYDELREKLVHFQGEVERVERERSHLIALVESAEATGSDKVTPGGVVVVDFVMPPSDADRVVTLLSELGRALHYRQILEEFKARGWPTPRGADPANTLLARYFSDPRLYRPRRGTYDIRPQGRAVRSVGTHRNSTGEVGSRGGDSGRA